MKNLAVLSVMCLLSSNAFAILGFLEKFNKAYPTSKTAEAKCQVCHVSEDPNDDGERNDYGIAYESNDMNFAAIEGVDSDTDGVINITEILAGTQPGNKDSH